MPRCLDVPSWRIASTKELMEFTQRGSKSKRRRGDLLVIRTQLKQADVYAYLRARFGKPNGFQNLLRKDDSDNLIHWDFNLKADNEDVYIQGAMRDVRIMLSEKLSDEQWKKLILSLKADFARLRREKAAMMKTFEKFVVFQNKFVVLADLCSDLHASIVDSPPAIHIQSGSKSAKSSRRLTTLINRAAKRATNLYGDSLKLKLLTPIMAEAFLNMLIVTLCKKDIRDDKTRYDQFLRARIPERLSLLSVNCTGFKRAADPSGNSYRNFLRVMNTRNFAIHGNVDPVREQIETVYFEGTRPLFVENGDHTLKLFEHLEKINAPEEVVKNYEDVHLFLAEVKNLLSPKYHQFFEHVISDPYPGYEVNLKRVTKILPSHNVAMLMPGERFDDELKVNW